MHIVVPDHLLRHLRQGAPAQAVVERWLVGPLGFVRRGHAVVRLRIGDAVHDLSAPCSGYVHQCVGTRAPVRRDGVLGEIGACHLSED